MSSFTMRRTGPGLLGASEALRQYLESLRHDMASRLSDDNQDYCQRCDKNSVWNAETSDRERRTPYADGEGRIDISRLLAEVPFAVYGLKGNPLGLHLSGLDRSGDNPGRVSLRYTSGEPGHPQRALDLTQNADLPREPREERMTAELRAITSLVLGCASVEQWESYESRGNIHRYWNLNYVSRAPRRNVTIHIDGKPVNVELARWQEPQQAALAHLPLDGRPAMAVSLAVSQVQFLGLLKSLAALGQ